jgi:hypothetical protein
MLGRKPSAPAPAGTGSGGGGGQGVGAGVGGGEGTPGVTLEVTPPPCGAAGLGMSQHLRGALLGAASPRPRAGATSTPWCTSPGAGEVSGACAAAALARVGQRAVQRRGGVRAALEPDGAAKRYYQVPYYYGHSENKHT